jgi:hypothetical protein
MINFVFYLNKGTEHEEKVRERASVSSIIL